MPKDLGGDAATKKRRENNYRAKKGIMSTDTNEPRSLENLDAGLPNHPAVESQPKRDCTPPCGVQKPETKPALTPLDASIPFKTQFGIVTAVQGWLEDAIFEFFRKWLPEALEAKDIDVAEKVELTDWADTIGKDIKALPKAATDRIPGTSLMQELRATYQLRNAAVKRQQLSSIRLLELLGAASNLVTIMKDERKMALIGALIGEIQAGARLLETRLEATKKAIVHDDEIIEDMKNTLTEQLIEVKKAAGARCEMNRKGVGKSLDIFLDNARKGSTSGGQIAILEDELLNLQESQETFLPKDFRSKNANISSTGFKQIIVRPAKLSPKDREEGGVEDSQERGKEDHCGDGGEDIVRHAVDGKARFQRRLRIYGPSTGTSSALKVQAAEDGRGNINGYPKAINPLSKNLTSESHRSASPIQRGSNIGFPFMTSHPKSTNLGKCGPTLDLGGDAQFTFKVGPRESNANVSSNITTNNSTEMESISTRTPRFGYSSPFPVPVPALSSTQPLFGQENEQAPKSISSELNVANTTVDPIEPLPVQSPSPIDPIEEAKPVEADREQGSSALSPLFAPAPNNLALGATTSLKEKQSAISLPATSQPQSDTTQTTNWVNIFTPPSSNLLSQVPKSSSGLGTSSLHPPSALPTGNFNFAKPAISQITRCFGTAESLPFNPLYLSERETQAGGRIADHMLITQSITFMMGHRNYSFEVRPSAANS